MTILEHNQKLVTLNLYRNICRMCSLFIWCGSFPIKKFSILTKNIIFKRSISNLVNKHNSISIYTKPSSAKYLNSHFDINPKPLTVIRLNANYWFDFIAHLTWSAKKTFCVKPSVWIYLKKLKAAGVAYHLISSAHSQIWNQE